MFTIQSGKAQVWGCTHEPPQNIGFLIVCQADQSNDLKGMIGAILLWLIEYELQAPTEISILAISDGAKPRQIPAAKPARCNTVVDESRLTRRRAMGEVFPRHPSEL